MHLEHVSCNVHVLSEVLTPLPTIEAGRANLLDGRVLVEIKMHVWLVLLCKREDDVRRVECWMKTAH